MMIVTPQAMTLTSYGKPASPPSHSPWKTLRVSHRLTASTTGNSPLTSYRGTLNTLSATAASLAAYMRLPSFDAAEDETHIG